MGTPNMILISGDDLPFDAIVKALQPLGFRATVEGLDHLFDANLSGDRADLLGPDHLCDEAELKLKYPLGHSVFHWTMWRDHVALGRTELGYWGWLHEKTRRVESHPVEG